MNAKELKILERIFDAEINGLLPCQFGNWRKLSLAIVQKLINEGFVKPMEKTLPGRFPVLLKGFELTERGRIAWCDHASATVQR